MKITLEINSDRKQDAVRSFLEDFSKLMNFPASASRGKITGITKQGLRVVISVDDLNFDDLL